MMSNTKTSRNIYFAFLTVFLTAALFTGCGKNEADHHAGEKTSENDAASGEMTVILPGNVKLELVKVEAGTFEMSARDKLTEDYKKDNAQLPFVIVDDEGNIDDDAMLSLLFENEMPHQATLTRDFYIGRTEVTQAQWKAVMGSNPSHFIGDDRPVEQVSWYNAMEFCGKLNELKLAPEGWRFTLPTETQWEFAARGGKRNKGYRFSGSDTADEVAWCDDKFDSETGTHPVGRKKPNELGLYDMSGNVCEWCLDDWIDDSSELKPEFVRGNDSSKELRPLRGGGWDWTARSCRSGTRMDGNPDIGRLLTDLGFRVALIPESY